MYVVTCALYSNRGLHSITNNNNKQGAIIWVVTIAVVLLFISNQKQPSCKKRCGPHKGHGEKRCEIQDGGQEMAVMVG